jgi:ribosomal protein L19
MNNVIDQIRIGGFVLVRYYLKGFIRIFEGVCLVKKGGVLLLRGILFGCAIELLLNYRVVCIIGIFVFKYKQFFFNIRRARLYFLRRRKVVL